MDNWPVSLQQKLNTSGFSLTYGNTLVRSDMDVGPAKVRSRFTDGVDVYSCSIFATYAELATLDTFYKTTLNNGALPFTFLDPISNSTQTFRFINPPQIKPLGGVEFEISMDWEKLP